ncbi:MAG: serine/threonine protein kinase [Burkholderiaceae bacterium]|jgi:serine/threonine protein kinase|nr:serine/threonine protein kinase [Burkholderiaceae bacterium]
MVRTSEESPVSHRDALAVGTLLSEFEIQGLLGVGGFGIVYRAWDHSLHRSVAIKEFMPTGMAERNGRHKVFVRSPEDRPVFSAGLRSFVDEAQLLAQFEHASLVKVFRIWEANNTAYMVMPLYQGMTLKQARETMKSPPHEAWLRQVIWSVSEALSVLHESQTMHRDVAPDNIFLQDKGPPVLLDLGAARRTIQDYTQKHTAILKVNYAPIEQYGDSQQMLQGPWTDLYALAAVIYECVGGKPTPPATHRVLEDRMVPFATVVRSVDAKFHVAYSAVFVSAIDAALVIRPEERTQDVPSFARMMDLHPVAHMDQFNWRAELGSPLVRAMRTLGVTLIEHDLRPKSKKRRSVLATDQDGPFANSAFRDSQMTDFLESREMEGKFVASTFTAGARLDPQGLVRTVGTPKAASLFQRAIRNSISDGPSYVGFSRQVLAILIAMVLVAFVAIAWKLFG